MVAVGVWAVFATGLGVTGQAGTGLQAGSGAAESVPTCQDTPVAVQAVYSQGTTVSGAYTVDLDGFEVSGIAPECVGMNLQLAVQLAGQEFVQLPGVFVVAADQESYMVPASGLAAHQPEQIKAYSLRLAPNPSAPTDLTVSAGDGQVAVAFTAPAAGTSTISAYEYSLDAGATWVRRTSTATSFTITGLTNATTYPIRVRAINTTGPSAPSDTVEATPRINAPTNLAATVDSTTATITFTTPQTVSTITNYAYSLDNGATWTELDPADTTSPITISGLTPNTTYPIRLRAHDTHGPGTPSTPITVTPHLDAPTNLTATAGNTTATITFTAPDTDGTITNYAYTLDNGATWTPLNPADTTSPITISGLTNNTTYTIALHAVDTHGTGTPSTPVTVTPEATDENIAPTLILGGGATGL